MNLADYFNSSTSGASQIGEILYIVTARANAEAHVEAKVRA